MVLLPGCVCCGTCIPFPIDESTSVEVDLSASGFGSYSATIEVKTNPSLRRTISASSSNATAGTYSMPLNGSYSGSGFSVTSYATQQNEEWLINQNVTIKNLVSLYAESPNGNTSRNTYHTWGVTRNCFKTYQPSPHNILYGAYTDNAWWVNPMSGQESVWYFGEPNPSGRVISSAENCNMPYTVSNKVRMIFSDEWQIASSSFPISQSFTETRSGSPGGGYSSVGFDVSVSVTEIRLKRGSDSVVWYTDSTACQ
jgi:hypothetical protein